MTGVADMVAYNRYLRLVLHARRRNAGPDVLGGMHGQALHAKHPAIPMGVSEYGAGSGLTQFSDDPDVRLRRHRRAGRRPEEYGSPRP